MAASNINDPERSCAEEMRTLAEDMHDEQSKQTMLWIAQEYEHLAKRAGDRATGAPPNEVCGCEPERALDQRDRAYQVAAASEYLLPRTN